MDGVIYFSNVVCTLLHKMLVHIFEWWLWIPSSDHPKEVKHVIKVNTLIYVTSKRKSSHMLYNANHGYYLQLLYIIFV